MPEYLDQILFGNVKGYKEADLRAAARDINPKNYRMLPDSICGPESGIRRTPRPGSQGLAYINPDAPAAWIWTASNGLPYPGGGALYVTMGAWSKWARDSALAMLKEHDDRIRRNGGIPNLDWTVQRKGLFVVYYLASLFQFCDDAKNLDEGELLRRISSNEVARWLISINGLTKSHWLWKVADGPSLYPYPPDKIEQLRFAKNLSDQRGLDQQLIDLGALAGLTDAELVLLSRDLPTDPIAQNLVKQLVNEQIPLTGEEFSHLFAQLDLTRLAEISAELTPRPTLDLPEANLGGDRIILKDPSLPIQPGNIAGGTDAATDIVRQELGDIAQGSPGGYREDAANLSREVNALETLNYWLANYPQIAIRPGDNEHVKPELLNHKWRNEWGHAPLVNVWVLPRRLPPPDLGVLGKIFSSPWSGLIAAIPYVGGVLYAIGSAAGQADVQQWINDHEVPLSVFEPQYEPTEFTVPFPLDWAQVAVKRPEYFPLMFQRFQSDIRADKFETASQAWQAMSGGKAFPSMPNYMDASIMIGPTSNRSGLITGDLPEAGTGAPFGSANLRPTENKPPKESSAMPLAILGAAAYLLS